MPIPPLTQTGSDSFNRADSGTLGSSWFTPGAVGATAIGILSAQAYGEGGSNNQACWNSTVGKDQYASIKFEGNKSGTPTNAFLDLTFRRSAANPNNFFFFTATQNSNSCFLLDNTGTLDLSLTLNTALAIGDTLEVIAYGLNCYILQNGTQIAGSPFTLPALYPHGSTGDATNIGFDLSGNGLAVVWSVGVVAATLKATDANGNSTDSTGNQIGGGAAFTYNMFGTDLILRSAPPGSAAYNSAFGSQSLTISNAGGSGSLPFTVSTSLTKPKRWLVVSPSSGDAGSGPVTVTVSFNPNGDDFASGVFGLLDGSFTANLIVTSGGQQIVVPCTLLLAKYPSRAGY